MTLTVSQRLRDDRQLKAACRVPMGVTLTETETECNNFELYRNLIKINFTIFILLYVLCIATNTL